MDVEEKVAEIVSIDNVHKTTLEERTLAILAIPEIKEGQELWEKRDRLVQLCDGELLDMPMKLVWATPLASEVEG